MTIQVYPHNSELMLTPGQRIEATTSARGAIIDGDTLALGVVLLAALVAHAFNMFNYPVYSQDEGIVSQQAWALINDQKLSPYTYAYEHPPLSTFMVGLWTLITGGFHTFGGAVNSGRVMMLVVHLLSVFFLYRTSRSLTRSISAATLTTVLFSLSPLAINYQRLLVVDNMMMLWVLAAVYFLVCNNGRLFNFFIASLMLGLATLTRETAILFAPAFILMVLRFADKFHRLFALWGAVIIGAAATLQFFLYAILKSELLPDNLNFQSELDGTAAHVSLFGTFFQNYHTATPVWNDNHGFAAIWQTWGNLDWIVLFGGLGCAALNLLFGFRRKENWLVPLFGGSYGVFLLFGGINSNYMVVALLPFLALAVGQTVGHIESFSSPIMSLGVLVVMAGLAGVTYISNSRTAYADESNAAYLATLNWVKTNISADRSMIISDALWVDLHDNYNGPAFPLAHSHWKAARDPDVRVKVFGGDYHNVDYLVVNDTISGSFVANGEAFPQQALSNSSLVRQFLGGDTFSVRKVTNLKPLVENNTLMSAYNYYRSRFVGKDGKISDDKGRTTIEQQANAMQMALWNNDQATFDSVWQWTALNLQMDNNLFRVDESSAANRLRSDTSDAPTNARADTDIALALVLAAKRWNDDTYTKEAVYILDGIWNKEVIAVNGHYYVKATTAAVAQTDEEVLLNMGAFSPHAYRFFADADPKHAWMSLYENGYAFLNKAAWYGKGDYHGIGLVPGLVIMNRDSEELRAVNDTYGHRLGDFDEEAQQMVWRVALDYEWNQSDQARDFIETTGWYLIKYWQKNQSLAGQFSNNGLPLPNTKNLSVYSVAGAQAAILNQIDIAAKLARGEKADVQGSSAEIEILARSFIGNFTRRSNDTGYWVRDGDIDAQFWGWMTTANHLRNLIPDFDTLDSQAK